MVVIEQEQQERKETVTHPPKASTDSKATENGDASDGFETASEHDVSDNDDDKGNSDHREEGREVATPEQKDKTNDDELKQKALSEANDAKVQGNKLFGEGKYDDALLQYEVALQKVESAPETNELRSICHSNRGVCFFKLAKYEDSIKECTKALELNPTYMKALTRRAEANEKLEHFEEAIADLKKILELDSSNDQARKSIRRLEPLAAEKREKMKEEMIAKLKDMGNSLLGRFGMSVDNFKTVKDPNTGSYSIQFQR